MQSWPIPKDPDEVLDYYFDWSDRLEVGETIASSTLTPSAGAGITISNKANVGSMVSFNVSGGVEGENVDITCRVVTNFPRTYDCTSRLRVRSR